MVASEIKTKMTKLSILICTIPKRTDFLRGLMRELRKQMTGLNAWDNIELLTDDRTDISIGEKRNYLLSIADGEYLAFIDDDDRISPNYLKLLLEGITTNPDCCSLIGEITEDGENPKKFIHSLKYTSWFEQDGIYFRNNNHLNTVRSSIAKQMKFPKTNHGEDKSYSDQLRESGLLKNEYWIADTIYFYDYRSVKPELK